MKALICCGVKSLPSMLSFQLLSPMCRLTERIVRSALVTAWRFATSPTRTSPFLANATMDGVVRDPSALAMTVGSPPSRTLTTEFVVPRSMPTARAMVGPSRGKLSYADSMLSEVVRRRQLWVERTSRNFHPDQRLHQAELFPPGPRDPGGSVAYVTSGGPTGPGGPRA